MNNMKLEININHLLSTLDKIETPTTRRNYDRLAGFLEGILYSVGKIKGDEDFIYKEIEVIEKGWFGRPIKIKRLQTYYELMFEKFQELIQEQQNNK